MSWRLVLALLLHAVNLLVLRPTAGGHPQRCCVASRSPCKRVGVIHRIRTRMQQGYASRTSYRLRPHALPTTILHPPDLHLFYLARQGFDILSASYRHFPLPLSFTIPRPVDFS